MIVASKSLSGKFTQNQIKSEKQSILKMHGYLSFKWKTVISRIEINTSKIMDDIQSGFIHNHNSRWYAQLFS